MTQTERRLEALEQQAEQRPLLGYKTFTQSDSDPKQYHEGTRGDPGRAYTRAEVDALGELGWGIILVVYHSDDPNKIKLNWGDELPDPAE